MDNLDLEKSIEKKMEALEKMKPFIEQCLTLNHDLNNPLAAVMGYTEYILMERETIPEDTAQLLEKVLLAAERMKLLVEDVSETKHKLAKEIDFELIISK